MYKLAPIKTLNLIDDHSIKNLVLMISFSHFGLRIIIASMAEINLSEWDDFMPQIRLRNKQYVSRYAK